MDSMEQNKIFAAVLLAALIAMTSGFFSELVFHQEDLEETAIFIDTSAIQTASTEDTGPKLVSLVTPLMADADPSKGETLTRACTACHTFAKNAPHKTGPNLWDVVNQDKGGKAGFAYSEAMTSVAGNWSYEALNVYLYAPAEYVSGTKMNYKGMKNAGDRADLIAYLRGLSDEPPALPDSAAYAENERAVVGPPTEQGKPQIVAAEEGSGE